MTNETGPSTRDFPDAEREFRRTFQLNPNYALAHQWYAAFLSDMGRHNEAIAEIKRALELDPLSVNVNTAAVFVYYYARQFDLAKQQARTALEIDPTFVPAHILLANVYQVTKDFPSVFRESEKAADLLHDEERRARIIQLEQAYKKQGVRGFYKQQIELLKQRPLNNPLPQSSAGPGGYALAMAYAELGEKDHAFEMLEQRFRERGFEMLAIKNEPRLDPLRSDSRFADLLRRMSLPQ